MITTADGTTYTFDCCSGITPKTGNFGIVFTKSNPTAKNLGFHDEQINLDIGMMPAIQACFADPINNGLPKFYEYEQWLVLDHSANPNESHLQFLTGGVIS